jgi:hypothetical protein
MRPTPEASQMNTGRRQSWRPSAQGQLKKMFRFSVRLRDRHLCLPYTSEQGLGSENPALSMLANRKNNDDTAYSRYPTPVEDHE